MKHLHTYKRIKQGERHIFKCVHPDCTHFTSRELLLGKRSLCPNCQKPMILSGKLLQLANPTCMDCKELKAKGEQVDKVTSNIERLFGL